jgi:hypothetical protein
MRRERTASIAGTLLVGTLVLGAVTRADGQSSPQAVTPPTGQTIVAIVIECTAPIDRQGLLHILPFREASTLQPDDLERARQRLTETELFTSRALGERRSSCVSCASRS